MEESAPFSIHALSLIIMRFIHNTTFNIEEEIEGAFRKAIREFYIPLLKNKEICSDILFTKIRINEENGKSFSLQLVFPAAEDYALFMEVYKDKMLGALTEIFGEKMLHFSTTLEEV